MTELIEFYNRSGTKATLLRWSHGRAGLFPTGARTTSRDELDEKTLPPDAKIRSSMKIQLQGYCSRCNKNYNFPHIHWEGHLGGVAAKCLVCGAFLALSWTVEFVTEGDEKYRVVNGQLIHSYEKLHLQEPYIVRESTTASGTASTPSESPYSLDHQPHLT